MFVRFEESCKPYQIIGLDAFKRTREDWSPAGIELDTCRNFVETFLAVTSIHYISSSSTKNPVHLQIVILSVP